jgi:hypothetical protein
MRGCGVSRFGQPSTESDITVFVNLDTNVDVRPLAVGQLIEVTGLSSQFTDHYEIDIRGLQDLAHR